MLREDYNALQAMLKEFRQELCGVTEGMERAHRQIREADAMVLALTEGEPEDVRVFSPRKAKNLDGDKIQEVCREKEALEADCINLGKRKAVLQRYCSTLEDVLSRQTVEDFRKTTVGGEERFGTAQDCSEASEVFKGPNSAETLGRAETLVRPEASDCLAEKEADGHAAGSLAGKKADGHAAGSLAEKKADGHAADLLAGKEKLAALTEREREILCQVAEGMLNKEIAAALDISEQTVKNHISNIFQKLGVADRTQAAVFSIKNGLVN